MWILAMGACPARRGGQCEYLERLRIRRGQSPLERERAPFAEYIILLGIRRWEALVSNGHCPIVEQAANAGLRRSVKREYHERQNLFIDQSVNVNDIEEGSHWRSSA